MLEKTNRGIKLIIPKKHKSLLDSYIVKGAFIIEQLQDVDGLKFNVLFEKYKTLFEQDRLYDFIMTLNMLYALKVIEFFKKEDLIRMIKNEIK